MSCCAAAVHASAALRWHTHVLTITGDAFVVQQLVRTLLYQQLGVLEKGPQHLERTQHSALHEVHLHRAP